MQHKRTDEFPLAPADAYSERIQDINLIKKYANWTAKASIPL